MVLSSQLPREGNSRRHMVSRRRRRRSPLPMIGAVVILIGIVAALMFYGGSPDDAQANETGNQNVAASDATTPAAPMTTPTSTPSRVAERPAAEQPRVEPIREREPQIVRQPRTAIDPAETFQPAGTDGPRTTPSRTTRPAPAETIARPVNATVQAKLKYGMDLITAGQLVEGRDALNKLLLDHRSELPPRDEEAVLVTMASVNDTLIFSKQIVEGDPLVDVYTIQSGDTLGKVSPNYKVPYQIVEKINGVDSRRIQVGQKIKMIKGPFHAVVVKSAFRMDVYLDGPDGRPVYITSFAVGLGEAGSTPHGLFRIGVKQKDPSWTNPRTHEHYAAGDPRNPIGKYWLALDGIEEATAHLKSYGIHGTIEPHTIGTEASMGCIRMRDDDIEMIFAMLQSGSTTVRIVP